MYPLYKELKECGFPQGGTGTWLQDPNSDDKVYVPELSELISTFLGDPPAWIKLKEAVTKAWIQNKK